MQAKPAVEILKSAPVVDFTGQFPGASHLPGFSREFFAIIRQPVPPRAVVIIDSGWRLDGDPAAAVVADHLNLTGDSPLAGPNHPAGERFPVVQNIYLTDALDGPSQVVAAGLKPGVKPDEAEQELLMRLGADCWCYNLVPAMLVAAHAGCRVLAVLLAPEKRLPQTLENQIHHLVRG